MKLSKIPVISSLVIIISFFFPIYFLFYGTQNYSFVGQPSESFWHLITSTEVTSGLYDTFVFAFFGGALGILWGFLYSWLVWRTNVPFKRILHYLPYFGFLMPEVIKALSWVVLFGPRAGIINQLFFPLLHGPLFNVFSLYGMVLLVSFGGLHIQYLTLSPAVMAIDPTLEETSRVSGRSTMATFIRVSLPVLTPSILGAYLLGTLWGLGNLDYPLVIGNLAGLNFLSFSVDYWANEHTPPNYTNALFISVFYVLVTIVTLAVYLYYTRKTYRFVTVTGKVPHHTVHNLGKWRWGALAVCIAILTMAWGLLLGVLIWMSISSGGVVTSSLTLSNFPEAFAILPGFWQSILNTVELGGVTGVVGAIFAILISYTAFRGHARVSRLVDTLAMLPMAFPGIVYGFALLWMFVALPGVTGDLYGTIWPLLIANLFVYLPHMVRQAQGWMVQISTEVEEASRVLGRGWLGTMRRIMLPLFTVGLINTILYGFVDAFRELGAIILLTTPSFLITVILVYDYWAQEPYYLNVVAAAAVVIAILVGAFLVLAQTISYRRSRWQRL